MKRIRNSIWILLSVSLLHSCNKQLPEIPNSETPVFYVKGTLDGQTIEIDAGVNQYLMESSSWMWNGVDVFRGELMNGDNSFLIDLFNGNILTNSTHEELLQMNHFSCAFLPTSFGNMSSAQLTNSNGIIESNWEVNGEQADLITFQSPGLYDLKFNVYSPTELSISNRVIVGYNTQSIFRLSASYDNQLVYANINENSVGIESVQWIYGNQSYTTSDLSVVFTQESGSKPLVAKVKFINGIERTRTILFGQNGYPYVEDYVYLIESTNQFFFDYKTELKMKIGGEIYTSIQTPQVTQTPIQIIEKVAYQDPITKQQALRLKLVITVKMKKMSNGEIVDGTFEASVGFPFAN